MKKLTMVLSLLALLIGVATASAQNGATTYKDEICGWTWNPCCDEAVDVCIKVNYVFDKNGYLQHINAEGSGTGATTGDTYNFIYALNQQEKITSNGAWNATVTFTFKLNDTGGDCGATVHETFHVTVDANGNVTSEVTNVTFECENGSIY